MRRWSVGDVMTTDVVTVKADTPYKDVVETLVRHGVSAAPVVDGEGRVLGVVSEADLLHKMEYAGAEPFAGFLERKRRRTARTKSEGERAEDLMTAPAIVVSPVESLTTAAKLLEHERVKRLPVVDQHGRLVGIVSRRDLLGLYLRDDDSIRTEIVDEVLRQTLWIEPETIAATVDRGVVSLAGVVDTRSTIPLVVHFVEGVAGVVHVENHLSYHVDDTAPANHRRAASR